MNQQRLKRKQVPYKSLCWASFFHLKGPAKNPSHIYMLDIPLFPPSLALCSVTQANELPRLQVSAAVAQLFFFIYFFLSRFLYAVISLLSYNIFELGTSCVVCVCFLVSFRHWFSSRIRYA